MYNIAIISNLPNIILADNNIFDIGSRFKVVTPIDNPVLVMVETDSNKESINSKPPK